MVVENLVPITGIKGHLYLEEHDDYTMIVQCIDGEQFTDYQFINNPKNYNLSDKVWKAYDGYLKHLGLKEDCPEYFL